MPAQRPQGRIRTAIALAVLAATTIGLAALTGWVGGPERKPQDPSSPAAHRAGVPGTRGGPADHEPDAGQAAVVAAARGSRVVPGRGGPPDRDARGAPSAVVFRSDVAGPQAGAAREPDADEAAVRAAVREVYAGKIAAERLGGVDGELVLTITAVPGQPFAEADFNLTSLGRQVRAGLTPANLREAVSP